MGNESSKSQPESSNSGNKNGKLETMHFLNENENEIINRVWIVKKSISILDRHIFFSSTARIFCDDDNLIKKIDVCSSERNDKIVPYFKHWAIILELSNGTFVNIQFGREGFSLKEFNKTDINGENILESIVETWGEDMAPYSFCYLGNANYEYKKLKLKLKIIKDLESKSYEEKGAVYYNIINKNCQHFACDIEKILFDEIQVIHLFNYYLEDFYKTFFIGININELKQKILKKRSNLLFRNKKNL